MSERLRVLIVDDEPANLQKLKRTFLNDYEVREAATGQEALKRLNQDDSIAAVITDQRMPGMSGVELLRASLDVNPDAVRIILTGFTAVDDMMDAINQGHVDRYITKPWEPASLQQTVRQELEKWRLRKENEQLSAKLKDANRKLEQENTQLKEEVELLKAPGRHSLIYRSRLMKDLLEMLDRVVATDSTVLLQGETGTGKELLARYIHDHSERRKRAFIPVNCGAIPADLVESAFFGHRKGAFTGATENKKGFFSSAHEGTIFLDEIGEAPLDLQVKLLRVLQEGEIYPVGAQQPEKIDVRVIGSTNRNLSRMVEEGRFRQDLFFRLNVFAVSVPPLRARKDDIEALATHFLSGFCSKLGKEMHGFAADTLALLKRYEWPGNVRELQNEIERMVILADSGRPIAPEMPSERIRFHSADSASGASSLKEQLAALEKRLILDSLRTHKNNRSHAAQSLGISRQTIISKIKEYRIG